MSPQQILISLTLCNSACYAIYSLFVFWLRKSIVNNQTLLQSLFYITIINNVYFIINTHIYKETVQKTRPTHVVDLACSSCIILQVLRPLSMCNDVKKNALSLFSGTILSLKTKYRKMRRLGTRINSNDSRLLLQCYMLPGC